MSWDGPLTITGASAPPAQRSSCRVRREQRRSSRRRSVVCITSRQSERSPPMSRSNSCGHGSWSIAFAAMTAWRNVRVASAARPEATMAGHCSAVVIRVIVVCQGSLHTQPLARRRTGGKKVAPGPVSGPGSLARTVYNAARVAGFARSRQLLTLSSKYSRPAISRGGHTWRPPSDSNRYFEQKRQR